MEIMTKNYYRYFGGLLQKQENWLNRMANEGYRLTAIGKLLYEFEECESSSVEYRVEYIASKSKREAEAYFHEATEHDFAISRHDRQIYPSPAYRLQMKNTCGIETTLRYSSVVHSKRLIRTAFACVL